MPLVSPFDKRETLQSPFDKSTLSSPFDIEKEKISIIESIAAGALSGLLTIPKGIGEAAEVLSDITGLSHGTLGEESRKAQEFLRKRVGKDKASQIIGQAAETITSVGSAILTGGVTKIKPLLMLSAGAGLSKTTEALREDEPALNAYGAGFVSFATEYITEKIPLSILGDKSLGFFTRMAAGALADIPGEMAATAMELSVIDKRIRGKDHGLSWGEYFQILGETAAVSAISTVGLSGASQAIQRVKRGKPLTEIPDHVSAIQDAIRGIQPIPPSETVVPIEKTHMSEVDSATRETSKSEFIGLQTETNPTGPRQELDLQADTSLEPVIPDSVPVPEADISDPTSVEAIYDEQKAFKKERGKLKNKVINVLKSINRNVLDVSNNLKGKLDTLGNAGLQVKIYHDLMAGANTKAMDDLAIIEREIFSGMNQQQTEMLDMSNFAKNHLAIRAEKGARFKLPNNTTEQKLQDFEEKIPPKDAEQIRDRQTKIRNVFKFLANLQKSEGLQTQAQTDSLNNREYYIPRQLLEYLDPQTNTKDRNGKVISVHDSGLKSLSEDGSDKLVEMDTRLLIQQAVVRTYARVFKNRAAKAMAELARTDFPNAESQKTREDLIRLAKIEGSTQSAFEIVNRQTGETLTEEAFESEKEAQELIKGDENIFEVRKVKVGVPIYEKPGSNERSIFAMEDGKLTRMIMPKEMANEWILRDPILSAQASNWIGWLSGSKILKAMATGVNPEFALTNIPRDMAHIYLTTEQYSSFAPKFIYQMMQDIKEVANDVELRGELTRMYTDHGGGMDFLSQQFRDNKSFPALSKGFEKVSDVMSYMGTKSEMLTRLALMNRALKNKKLPHEAVWIARNYLDFSQGGSIIKAGDTFIPYLNASIQGMRGLGRAAKNNPKLFGIKLGNITAVSIGLFLANFYNKDPETGKSVYEDVPESDKVRNWIITTPLWFRDKDNTKRYYYMKIPKDQGQRVFATAAEALLKKRMGMEVDGDAIADSILDFFPVLPTETLPPVADATIGYMVNKDLWRRKDIWRGPPVTPSEEYTKYTPVQYKKAGELLGASPERLKYAVEQYMTKGNIWTSIVGFGAKQVFDEMNEQEMDKTVQELFASKPGIRRFLRSTRPESEQQRRIKEAKIEANTERRRVNRKFDALTEQFYNGRTDRNEIEEFLRRQPKHDIKRLTNRLKRTGKLRNIPNRRLWLNLLDLPPEYRAINYWNTWTQLDEAGRLEMDKTSLQVPGFRTKRFNRQFNKMRRLNRSLESRQQELP